MDIFQLCDEIDIQAAVKTQVFQFANYFDFATVETLLKDFLCMKK